MGKVSDYLIRVLLTFLLLFSAPANLVLASDVMPEDSKAVQTDKKFEEEAQVSDRHDEMFAPKIQKEIRDAIEEIYGKKTAKRFLSMSRGLLKKQ